MGGDGGLDHCWMDRPSLSTHLCSCPHPSLVHTHTADTDGDNGASGVGRASRSGHAVGGGGEEESKGGRVLVSHSANKPSPYLGSAASSDPCAQQTHTQRASSSHRQVERKRRIEEIWGELKAQEQAQTTAHMAARGKRPLADGSATASGAASANGVGGDSRGAKRRKRAQALLAGIFGSKATAAAIVNRAGVLARAVGPEEGEGGDEAAAAAAAERRAELAAHASKVLVTEKKKFAGQEIE